MIFERWARERLGKDVGSIQKAGNVDWDDCVVVSQVPDVKMPHLDVLRPSRYFGRVLTESDGSGVVNKERSCWKGRWATWKVGLGAGRYGMGDQLGV